MDIQSAPNVRTLGVTNACKHHYTAVLMIIFILFLSLKVRSADVIDIQIAPDVRTLDVKKALQKKRFLLKTLSFLN